MTEKFPPHHDFRTPRNDLGEYSDILDELKKIRQDIERDSLSISLGDSGNLGTENFSTPPDSSQRFYRFDHNHSERVGHGTLNPDSQNTLFSRNTLISEKIIPDHDCDLPDIDVTEALTPRHGSDVSYQPKWEQSDYYPNQPSRHKTSKSTEIKNHRRHDDVPPVVIPISQVGTQTTSRKGVFSPGKSRKPTHVNQLNQQNDYPDGSAVDLSMLPWGLFSQYENETFVNLASNASNLSLFIGWGAIASGIVIFVRSFFVSSMIWLNYGLPVLALGAACLFLGIILSILSEKMQHINDLKQSLTAHRILNPTKREPETSVRQQKYIEVEDVYDRLLKLRSDIDELIDEWATPAQ